MDAREVGVAHRQVRPAEFDSVANRLLTCTWFLLLILAIAAPIIGAYTIARSPPLPGAPSPWVLFAAKLVASLFLVVGSGLLFWRRRADPVAVLLAIAYLATGASLHFIEGVAASPPFERVRLVLEVLGIVCTTVAMLRFPDGRYRPRWTRFAVVPLLAWAMARATDWLTGPTNAVMSVGIMLFSVVVVVLRYRMLPQGTERQQVRWALLGFAIGLALNMVAVAMFAHMAATPPGREVERLWLAARVLNSLFLISMACGLLVSILRYRLYDVDAVISRSAAYGGLTVMLVALFAATEKVVEVIGQQWLRGSAGAVTAGVAAAVVAVLAAPLHSRAQGWAQRRFQRNLVHLRQSVPECAADLRETTRVDELTTVLLHHVVIDVRAQHAAIIHAGKVIGAQGIDISAVENWRRASDLCVDVDTLSCDKQDSVFPLRVPLRLSYSTSQEPVGWFLIGPRPDGSFYGAEERGAICFVAGPIGRALHVAALRQRGWDDLHSRCNELSARLSMLEHGNADAQHGPARESAANVSNG